MTTNHSEQQTRMKYKKSSIKPTFQINPVFSRMKVSATLEMSLRVKSARALGNEIINFGLGESPFGPPKSVTKELQKYAHTASYLPTQGIIELRKNISSFYSEYLTAHGCSVHHLG